MDGCRDSLVARDSEQMQTLAQGGEKILGAGVLAPIFGRDRLPVRIKIRQKARGAHPAPAHRRIHHLNVFVRTSPYDDEVRDTAGQRDDGDGGECTRFIDQHVIERAA